MVSLLLEKPRQPICSLCKRENNKQIAKSIDIFDFFKFLRVYTFSFFKKLFYRQINHWCLLIRLTYGFILSSDTLSKNQGLLISSFYCLFILLNFGEYWTEQKYFSMTVLCKAAIQSKSSRNIFLHSMAHNLPSVSFFQLLHLHSLFSSNICF